MTKLEMQDPLNQLGLKKIYQPIEEAETGRILLCTRRPAAIEDGKLSGSEIALVGQTFRVWTGQKQKARKMAAVHGLRVRLLDSEAELAIPAGLADAILPVFGARVKRQVSPETREALRSRLATRRQLPFPSGKTPTGTQSWTPGISKPTKGPFGGSVDQK